MHQSPRGDFWLRSVVALILIVANVCAPFRTGALGRALLRGEPHGAAIGSVVRVRAVSSVGLSHGFRAVVGLAKGDPGVAATGPSLGVTSTLLASPSHPLHARHDGLPVAPSHPPLRC